MDLGRKLYSLKEFYWIYYNMVRTMVYIYQAKKNHGLTRQFRERIMIAVTEVNGCPLCSYAHTKVALVTGMSIEEIQDMFAGDINNVPADELAAIMFAQHYAESRGNPSEEAWNRIVEIYGATTAKGILGAIRAIMFGNADGIAWGSFFSRFIGKPDKRSNLLYEIGMMITTVTFFPAAVIHAIISAIMRTPII
ncbi:MAG: carboxymuconolactone decarboxylase family protein [Brevinematales bacterium]|nr:carboxymuconolactone decarboxylase family protein [Brevinematales bacterium]